MDCIWLTRLFGRTKKNKNSFSITKRDGMKAGLLFASMCDLNYTKDKLQSELVRWNHISQWQMFGSSFNKQMNHTRMKTHQEWKYFFDCTKQRKYNYICLLHASAWTTIRSMKKWRRVHVFLLTWTIKIQLGDEIIHKLLCLLDSNMSQYMLQPNI